MKVHPEDVAVQYERLVALSQELSKMASRLGGQAGEALLDESAAKASLTDTIPCLLSNLCWLRFEGIACGGFISCLQS